MWTGGSQGSNHRHSWGSGNGVEDQSTTISWFFFPLFKSSAVGFHEESCDWLIYQENWMLESTQSFLPQKYFVSERVVLVCQVFSETHCREKTLQQHFIAQYSIRSWMEPFYSHLCLHCKDVKMLISEIHVCPFELFSSCFYSFKKINEQFFQSCEREFLFYFGSKWLAMCWKQDYLAILLE